MEQESTQSVKPSSSSVVLNHPLSPEEKGKGIGVTEKLLGKLSALCRPGCPNCKQRALQCCYEMPDEYTEVAPRYYQCTQCSACFAKTLVGPWVAIKAEQLPQATRTKR